MKGYTEQTSEAVALANEGKELEERYLRWLDKMRHTGISRDVPKYDQWCVAEARTCIETGAMWAIRAIFQPQRIALPEDAQESK